MYKDTSAAAAVAIKPHKVTQALRVLRALQCCPLGATRDHLQHGTGMDGNTLRPRVLELIRDGYVHETRYKRQTRSGRFAYILNLTRKGMTADA